MKQPRRYDAIAPHRHIGSEQSGDHLGHNRQQVDHCKVVVIHQMYATKGDRGGIDQHTLMSANQAQRPIAGFPVYQHRSEPQRHQQHQRIAQPRQLSVPTFSEQREKTEYGQASYHHVFLFVEKQEASKAQLLNQRVKQDEQQQLLRGERHKVRRIIDHWFLGNPPLQKHTQNIQQQGHGKQPERPPAINGSTRRMRVFQKQQEVLPHTPLYRRIQLFIIPHLFFVWV